MLLLPSTRLDSSPNALFLYVRTRIGDPARCACPVWQRGAALGGSRTLVWAAGDLAPGQRGAGVVAGQRLHWAAALLERLLRFSVLLVQRTQQAPQMLRWERKIQDEMGIE